jgi:hypothetical protein
MMLLSLFVFFPLFAYSTTTVVFYKDDACRTILTSLSSNDSFSYYNDKNPLIFYLGGCSQYAVSTQLNPGDAYILSPWHFWLQIDLYSPTKTQSGMLTLFSRQSKCSPATLSIIIDNKHYFPSQWWYGWISQDYAAIPTQTKEFLDFYNDHKK